VTAREDAGRLAVDDMERAGIDILTDGEIGCGGLRA
jgi:methionine synthase II (cobalamin-independent)